MADNGVVVDGRVGPFDCIIDREVVSQYAAATNDPSPAVRDGRIVPPVALVTQCWTAQNAGREALVSSELQATASGGVHGSHDIVVHRPIEMGEQLRVWVEGHGARTKGANSLVVLRYRAFDRLDRLVAEQWWTTVYLGATCNAVGADPPDHTFPEASRERHVGTSILRVDAEMAHRYAELSGDWSAHHFSLEAARRTGFQRTFLHGLGAMSLCSRAVVGLVAGGDPSRLRRLAVRFMSPTWLNEDLAVHVYDAGPLGYAFEAECAGVKVIGHGSAELT